MSKETHKALTNRIIESMAKNPDSWKSGGHWRDVKYVHPSGISVHTSGGVMSGNVHLHIGWWGERKMRKTVNALRLEKAVRTWDRQELNS